MDNLLKDRLHGLLPSIMNCPDADLVDEVWVALASKLTPSEFGGSSRLDSIVEWIRTEFHRLCRRSGNAGQIVLEQLRRESVQHDAELVSIVATFLIEHILDSKLDLHVIVALAVLIVRHTRVRATPRDGK